MTLWATSGAKSFSPLKALSNRIEVSFGHCIGKGRPTKSGGRNWVNQFRSPVVLRAIVQDYVALHGAVPVLGAARVLISIVLVAFMALAGFLIVR
jgi:hypothetical protein